MKTETNPITDVARHLSRASFDGVLDATVSGNTTVIEAVGAELKAFKPPPASIRDAFAGSTPKAPTWTIPSDALSALLAKAKHSHTIEMPSVYSDTARTSKLPDKLLAAMFAIEASLQPAFLFLGWSVKDNRVSYSVRPNAEHFEKGREDALARFRPAAPAPTPAPKEAPPTPTPTPKDPKRTEEILNTASNRVWRSLNEGTRKRIKGYLETMVQEGHNIRTAEGFEKGLAALKEAKPRDTGIGIVKKFVNKNGLPPIAGLGGSAPRG